MKKFGLAPSLMAVFCMVAVGIGALSAQARQQYNNEFKDKYIDPKSKEPEKKKLVEAFTTAKCGACHVGTKDKKTRNAYGKELEKILSKNEKGKDKIAKALEDVEKVKLDEKDPKSKTYGDRIKEGLLPNPEEEKK
jgi:hypothetical protein